jgi:pre-rRNA-processing protein TSR3
MRSSANTPNPRRNGALRLLVVLAREDHPKACTGRRLLRWGRVAPVPWDDARSPTPVVLDPYAPTPLSTADRKVAEDGGVLVVDCSWNRLAARGTFPGARVAGRSHGVRRRLPFLIATNPQHYGRVAQLNTVEAFSAAAYLLGRGEQAAQLTEGFRGEEEFLPVNRDRLDRYRAATGPEGVREVERTLFGGP